MEFPRYHRDIVTDLMDGKFILASDPKFIELKNNQSFYEKFFKESFRYELEVKSDYGYILSYETNEQLSRDICIFFAILCYELDKDGKNFLEELQYAEFELEQLDNYFDNSPYLDLIKSNKQLQDAESRKQFVNTLSRRNIVEKASEKKFSFTQAYKVFVDFASDFAKGKLAETEEQPTSDSDSGAYISEEV
jgi:hypothetical protein